MWIVIQVNGKTELLNMAKAERVYEDAEGVTCIELRDSVIETETSVSRIAMQLQSPSSNS